MAIFKYDMLFNFSRKKIETVLRKYSKERVNT